jgi:N-methylhydantoinase B
VTLATNHCAQEVAEAVIKALAGACPEPRARRLVASLSASPSRERTRAPSARSSGISSTRAGGGGASSAGDGWETAGEGQAAGGIKFGSVEVAEARFPLFFETHEFRPDSFGDGQVRGGVGSVLTLRMETTEPAKGNTAGDGVRHPSYGILGGKDGLPHRYVLVAGGKRRVLKTKEVGIPIPPAPSSTSCPRVAGAGASRRGAPRPPAPRTSRTGS